MSLATSLANNNIILQTDWLDWVTDPDKTASEEIGAGLVRAAEDTTKELYGDAIGTIDDIIVELINAIILPSQPPQSNQWIDNDVAASGVQSDIWTAMFDVNEIMTTVALALFGVLVSVWLFGVGIGYISQSEIAETFWVLLLGFIGIVANEELQGLIWAFIYVTSNRLLEFPINGTLAGPDPVAASIGLGAGVGGGGLLLTGSAFAAVAANIASGGTVAIAVAIIVLPAIILLLSAIITLFGVNLIAVFSWGVFPMIILGLVIAEIIPRSKGKIQKFSGFFTTPIYMPIFYAIIFKSGAVVINAFQFGKDADAGIMSATMGILVGPWFGVGLVLLALYVTFKQFSAGAAVLSMSTKAVTTASTVAVAAATGGAGAALKGFAYSGSPSSALASTLGSAAGSGSGGGASGNATNAFDDEQREPDIDPENQEENGVFGDSQGGLFDFMGTTTDDGLTGRFRDTPDTSLSEAQRRSLGANDDRFQSPQQITDNRIFDNLTEDNTGITGGIITDTNEGLERFDTKYDDLRENIAKGNASGKDVMRGLLEEQVAQSAPGELGVGEYNGETVDFDEEPDKFVDMKMEEFEALVDRDHPFYDENILESQALNQFMDEEISAETKATLGLTGGISANGVTTTDELPGDLADHIQSSAARHGYTRNELDGLTTGNPDDYNAAYVEYGEAQDGNVKSESLGFSATPTSQWDYDSIDDTMSMEATDDGMIKFVHPGDKVDLDNSNPLNDAKQLDDGRFLATPEQMAAGLNEVVEKSDGDITADRESSILVGEAKKRQIKIEETATDDLPTDFFTQHSDPTHVNPDYISEVETTATVDANVDQVTTSADEVTADSQMDALDTQVETVRTGADTIRTTEASTDQPAYNEMTVSATTTTSSGDSTNQTVEMTDEEIYELHTQSNPASDYPQINKQEITETITTRPTGSKGAIDMTFESFGTTWVSEEHRSEFGVDVTNESTTHTETTESIDIDMGSGVNIDWGSSNGFQNANASNAVSTFGNSPSGSTDTQPTPSTPNQDNLDQGGAGPQPQVDPTTASDPELTPEEEQDMIDEFARIDATDVERLD